MTSFSNVELDIGSLGFLKFLSLGRIPPHLFNFKAMEISNLGVTGTYFHPLVSAKWDDDVK